MIMIDHSSLNSNYNSELFLINVLIWPIIQCSLYFIIVLLITLFILIEQRLQHKHDAYLVPEFFSKQPERNGNSSLEF